MKSFLNYPVEIFLENINDHSMDVLFSLKMSFDVMQKEDLVGKKFEFGAY